MKAHNAYPLALRRRALAMSAAGMIAREVAYRLGVSISVVHQWRCKASLQRRKTVAGIASQLARLQAVQAAWRRAT
jgi:transposase